MRKSICSCFTIALFTVCTMLVSAKTFCKELKEEKEIHKIEQTLCIIKPDAVKERHIGAILERLEKAGFTIVGLKMVWLKPHQAENFYIEHKEKPFFKDLVSYMSSGPIVALVLQADNAIVKNRELMGATNPQKAALGTLRHSFGKTITENAVHGSDSPQAAAKEIAFFFQNQEIISL